ncbi:protein FAM186A-like [Ostrinia furnacalis]|uniref:protein FAM186A-like n=1 Tax=Ostrinia furnacalis TaxID=93504 RepID=UPI00103F2AD8|nr:protein FAM186A-like [Ostrinia furnacalis]
MLWTNFILVLLLPLLSRNVHAAESYFGYSRNWDLQPNSAPTEIVLEEQPTATEKVEIPVTIETAPTYYEEPIATEKVEIPVAVETEPEQYYYEEPVATPAVAVQPAATQEKIQLPIVISLYTNNVPSAQTTTVSAQPNLSQRRVLMPTRAPAPKPVYIEEKRPAATLVEPVSTVAVKTLAPEPRRVPRPVITRPTTPARTVLVTQPEPKPQPVVLAPQPVSRPLVVAQPTAPARVIEPKPKSVVLAPRPVPRTLAVTRAPTPIKVAEPQPKPIVLAPRPTTRPVVVAQPTAPARVIEPKPQPVVLAPRPTPRALAVTQPPITIEVAEPQPEPIVVAPQPVSRPLVVAQPTVPAIVAEPKPQPVVLAPRATPRAIAVTQTPIPTRVIEQKPRPVVLTPRPAPRPIVVTESPVTVIAEPKPRYVSPPVYDTTEPRQLLDYQCASANGYYGIAGDCDNYVECRKYIAVMNTCPSGLHFNSAATYPDYPCGYPSEVVCESNAVRQIAQPTEECPDQYGMYPTSDCSKYTMCQAGVAYIMDCPAGLVFNEATSTCDWPENVPGCKADLLAEYTCPALALEEDGSPSDEITKYRYKDSCNEYVACLHGQPRLLKCDEGLSFHPESEMCVDSDYVANCRSY